MTGSITTIHAARCHHFRTIVHEIDLPPAQAHAGGARACAVRMAFEAFGAQACDYLLTTDADARLAPDALTRMEAAFARGADTVLAKIECVHDPLDPVTQEALDWGTPQVLWRHKVRQLAETIATGTVPFPPLHDDYGAAGIAITVDAYRRLGGFPCVPSDEDRALVGAADRAGLRVDRQSGAVVQALARATGRAAGGMATALATNADAAARGDARLVERHDLTAARLYAHPDHAHAFADCVAAMEPVEDAIAGIDRLIATYARKSA